MKDKHQKFYESLTDALDEIISGFINTHEKTLTSTPDLMNAVINSIVTILASVAWNYREPTDENIKNFVNFVNESLIKLSIEYKHQMEEEC